MRFFYRYKRVTAIFIFVMCMMIICPLTVLEAYAGIKDATVFKDVDWKYLGESPVISETGWLQSMCSTEDYIICLENSSKKDSSPDTFLAFYKNDVDENGNPVERYSLAKTVTEKDYEHANGMTYNPHTKEILVVGATPLDEANRGLVYIVDATTLKFKRSVKLSNTYKAIGVAYSEDTNHYLVHLVNDSYTQSFFIVLDMNFQQVGDVIPTKMWEGIVFQDFCVSGDYIISLAFTNKVSNSNVLNIYSISSGEFLVTYDLDILENNEFIEPESISEMGPGEIIIANAMKKPNRISFYKTTVAAAFKLSTKVENGTITGSQKTVDYGSDYTVNYQPEENFEMDTITIDGQNIDPAQYPDSYVFKSVSTNHTIDVKFKEKPKFNLTTTVENGYIDASVVRHRDNNWTVGYGPNEHYEISEILVDGLPVSAADAKDQYTFENIQDNHRIDVRFKEIPSFEIATNVVNGTISETAARVYRDEDYTVYYKSDEDYKLAWIEVDGVRNYMYDIRDNWNDYTFENIQGAHSISVVYYWKYLPFVVLFGVIILLSFFLSLIVLSAGYSKRRVMRRKYKRRRRIKARAAKNRKRAEVVVRAKMEAEALFESEPSEKE